MLKLGTDAVERERAVTDPLSGPPLRLYNTRSRKVEDFDSRGGPVSVYVCGVTPYDTTHLGHAFTYASLDVLIRYLEFRGCSVNYVQNVTDIDDDILRKASEVEEDWRALGDRWTAHFIRDMVALNVRPPDYFPRATDFVERIIAVVQRLLSVGVAYESGGSVYFHIDAWPEYGELSGLAREEMLPIANERGNHPADPNKRDPLDFVLWQAQAPGEPAWESPWGRGRPGWHIECSTMAMHLLGATIDVHSGGSDLVFPHHESEIAQAEGVTGHKPFVRHWVHTAMVRHRGEKMSKSLGNLVMVADLLREWTPDALRLYLARHHYRQPWSHRRAELETSERLAQVLMAAVQVKGGSGSSVDACSATLGFRQAMDSDLDTPKAIETLTGLAEDVREAARVGKCVEDAQEALSSMCRVFGLRLGAERPYERVTNGWTRYLEGFT